MDELRRTLMEITLGNRKDSLHAFSLPIDIQLFQVSHLVKHARRQGIFCCCERSDGEERHKEEDQHGTQKLTVKSENDQGEEKINVIDKADARSQPLGHTRSKKYLSDWPLFLPCEQIKIAHLTHSMCKRFHMAVCQCGRASQKSG